MNDSFFITAKEVARELPQRTPAWVRDHYEDFYGFRVEERPGYYSYFFPRDWKERKLKDAEKAKATPRRGTDGEAMAVAKAALQKQAAGVLPSHLRLGGRAIRRLKGESEGQD